MARINLNSIILKFPDKHREATVVPDQIFQDYQAEGYFLGQKIGHILITIPVKYDLQRRNDYWFHYSGNKIIPRPVAIYQGTDETYRGEGVGERLLVLCNKIVKAKFGEPIASDTSFLENDCDEWKEKGYAEFPAMQIWKRLQKKGKAVYQPYNDEPRWVMK